ncbi:hypothetical protein Leryth_021582 [Lithospermum erythrorhizon]|nr:hypothetical protein Leryth_021582 [Lithospermum erythrorhizon]
MKKKERDIDNLPKNKANYASLSPVGFLERAGFVYPNRKSIVHGSVEYTWKQTYQRCRRLASALTNHSISFGSTVAVIAPNVPAMYEAHFGVPMSGAVINAVNIRLNAQTVSFLLGHSQSAVIMVDQEFVSLVEDSLKILAEKEVKFKPPILIVIADKTCDPKELQYALAKGYIEYEKFLETGELRLEAHLKMEWHEYLQQVALLVQQLVLRVVLHHRGAYLMALSNAVNWGMNEGAVYLWTLPMFHCNGWCFTWALAAISGTNICLRQVDVKSLIDWKFLFPLKLHTVLFQLLLENVRVVNNNLEVNQSCGVPMCSVAVWQSGLQTPYLFWVGGWNLSRGWEGVTAKGVYSAIADHGVTHFCAAPIVLNTIVNAPKSETILPLPRIVHVMTGPRCTPPLSYSAAVCLYVAFVWLTLTASLKLLVQRLYVHGSLSGIPYPQKSKPHEGCRSIRYVSTEAVFVDIENMGHAC